MIALSRAPPLIDRSMIGPSARAVEDRDLAALEQPGQTTDQLVDDRLLALEGLPSRGRAARL